MSGALVTNITPDLLRVHIPSLSLLALINLASTTTLQKFWYQEKKECYFQSDFSDRRGYFELTDNLLRLSSDLNLSYLEPLAKLMQLEFIIESDYWPIFLGKLAGDELQELRNIALELGTISHATIQENSTIPNIPSCNCNANSNEVSLIDLDRSMENKLIFYFLFQASSEPVEKIVEKIDLMTMEQKEMFVEQIFQKSPLQKLPKIIYLHPFATIKLYTPLNEILPLILSNKIKIILKKPTCQALTNLSPEITNSPHYSRILNILETVKTFQEQNQNNYVLPLALKQTALISLDLQGMSELTGIATNIKEKIFRLINQEVPFTQGFIKN